MRAAIGSDALLIAVLLFNCRAWGQAMEPTDCPLARTPYSIDTPLIDILLDPKAREVWLQASPQAKFSTKPPTFAAILSPRNMGDMFSVSLDKLEELNRALAAISISDEAAVQRCARYDHTPPDLPAPSSRPAILVFEKITGFRDAQSVDAARKSLGEMALRRGWSMIFTDNGAVFNSEQLKLFDAVLWNNVSGDALTIPQENAFISYLESGGGYVGIHGSGGDPVYVWNWYVDTLLGAQFIGHPLKPQFQVAIVNVQKSQSGITEGLPDRWGMKEEWYSFGSNPRLKGARILLTLDESTYDPPSHLRMGAEHPIAWTNCIKDGRAFYTAIGHRPESYSDANSARLLEQGIAWSAGGGKTGCKNGHEVRNRRLR